MSDPVLYAKPGETWTIHGTLTHFSTFQQWRANVFKDIPLTDVIQAVQDTHPGLLWNPWRARHFPKHSLEESVRQVLKLNRAGLTFITTFNNTELGPEHLQDPDCEWWLDQLGPGNPVLVGSMELRDKIRDEFRGTPVHAALEFNKRDIEWYRQAVKEYDQVQVGLDLIKSPEVFLDELKTDKLQVTVNEECIIQCPYDRGKEIRADSLNSLQNTRYYRYDTDVPACRYKQQVAPRPLLPIETTRLTRTDLAGWRNIGVNKFQIGRRFIPFQELRAEINYYLYAHEYTWQPDRIPRRLPTTEPIIEGQI